MSKQRGESLKEFRETLGANISLFQDGVESLSSEFPSVVWDSDPDSCLRFFEDVVASSDTMYDESGSLQRIHGLLAAGRRQLHAATSTTASSTPSSLGTGSPSARRLSM